MTSSALGHVLTLHTDLTMHHSVGHFGSRVSSAHRGQQSIRFAMSLVTFNKKHGLVQRAKTDVVCQQQLKELTDLNTLLLDSPAFIHDELCEGSTLG